MSNPKITWSDFPVTRPQSDYLYDRRGPWPQPQPAHPLGFAPGVVHVPQDEIRHWNRTTGLRYTWTVLTYWPSAAWYAFKHRALEPLSDEQFERYLTHSALSKFISNELNEPEKCPENEKLRIFEEFLKKEPDEKFWVSDFTLVKDMTTYPGVYVAPTMVLFKGKLVNGQRKVVAIYFQHNNLMLTPEDGNAWELAKYFVMQGASLRISLSAHANLHFPYDSINAISKSSLPKDSVLLRLLLPHLELSLELNYNVLNSKTSPIQNPHYLPYAALPSGPEGLMTLFLFGYYGMRNNPPVDKKGKPIENPSYPQFRLRLEPNEYHSDYGTFLMAYFRCIEKYVKAVIDHIPQDEFADIRLWANYVSHYVPGFPSGDEIFVRDEVGEFQFHTTFIDENLLAKAIANIIWDLSVGHAADHYDYSTINVNHMPFIIRVPPPDSKDIPPIDRKAMIKWIDIFRHRYEREMFFVARNVTLLKDIQYGFDKPGEEPLRKLNEKFLNELHETEKNLTVYNYIPLAQIARSIQY
ncbi:MAG: hypothetical protein H6575_19245 [Lewinellaceae bacterium]|nr:hypothetical protein [Saprospiraceae bacterium]MCB9356705.1 hypothetical protein [Lewinellaceae bacterium]